MLVTPDDQFWNDLLRRIRRSKVIPVIGPGAITSDPSDDFIYPGVVARLAQQVGAGDPAPVSLPQLVQKVQGQATALEDLRMSLQDELDQFGTPGRTLRELAAISRFKLYLSATPDSLLARALDFQRPPPPGDLRPTSQLSDVDDLPEEFDKLTRPYVYSLFGRSSLTSPMALSHEDAFEFLLKFGDHLRACSNLPGALKDANFLFLGLSEPEWLLRLLVRFADGKPLGEGGRLLYLAAREIAPKSRRVVAFFDPHAAILKMASVDPRAFVAELASRWAADEAKRQPNGQATGPIAVAPYTAAEAAQPGCIFISFASADVSVAVAAATQIRAAGGFVWLDRWNLSAGDKWDQVLKEAVTKRCGVFLSLVSKNTETRIEGYFIKERNWAAQRYESFAERAKFYFPLRIDEGVLIPDNEPIKAADFQGRTLEKDGSLPADLVAALVATQNLYCQQQGLKRPSAS